MADEIPKLSPGQWYTAQSGPAASPEGTPPQGERSRGVAILLVVLGAIGTGLGSYILWYATRFTWIREDDLTQALAIGGLGVLLLAIGLQRLVRGTAGWIAAAAALLVPAAIGAVVVLRAQSTQGKEDARLEAQQRVYDRLMRLCTTGTAVPAAAPYDGAPGLHPTAFFTTPSEGDTYGWFGDATPESWRPRSVEAAQLVACNKTTRDVLESCSYSTSAGDRYVTRIRYVQEVVLVEARTARELTRVRLEGSEPGACPEAMSFSEYETMKDITGSFPTDEAIVETVRPWIDAGPAGAPSIGEAAQAAPGT